MDFNLCSDAQLLQIFDSYRFTITPPSTEDACYQWHLIEEIVYRGLYPLHFGKNKLSPMSILIALVIQKNKVENTPLYINSDHELFKIPVLAYIMGDYSQINNEQFNHLGNKEVYHFIQSFMQINDTFLAPYPMMQERYAKMPYLGAPLQILDPKSPVHTSILSQLDRSSRYHQTLLEIYSDTL